MGLSFHILEMVRAPSSGFVLWAPGITKCRGWSRGTAPGRLGPFPKGSPSPGSTCAVGVAVPASPSCPVLCDPHRPYSSSQEGPLLLDHLPAWLGTETTGRGGSQATCEGRPPATAPRRPPDREGWRASALTALPLPASPHQGTSLPKTPRSWSRPARQRTPLRRWPVLPSWIWLGPPGKAARHPHPSSAGKSRDRLAPSTWTPRMGPSHTDTACPAPLQAWENLKGPRKSTEAPPIFFHPEDSHHPSGSKKPSLPPRLD